MEGASSPASSQPLHVVEFFAGVGGLHYALGRANVPHTVVRAYDLDTVAASVYRHNFGETRLATVNICGLKASDLRSACANNDVWLLSPPCQPYTRQGLQLAEQDG